MDQILRMIGQILIEKGLMTQQQLEEALQYQKNYGGRLGWILASLGYIKRLDLYKVLSEQFNLELNFYPDVIKVVDLNFLKKFDPYILTKYECIPAKEEGENVLVYTSYPDSEKLRKFSENYLKNKTITLKLITDLDLIRTLEWAFKEKYIDRAIHGLFYVTPELSASLVFSKTQVLIIAILIFLALLWLYFDPISLAIFSSIIVQFFYLIALLFKFIVSLAGGKTEMTQFITDEEVKNLEEENLPVYTILVPVYKEPEVIGILINSLKKMDYPQNKLDIILLLEEDDKETLEAAKAHQPPANWRFIIVPKSQPKTKPKACNYGLFFARGKYLTIYDAEDIPEPDQLKKSVIAFKKGGDKYICFQAQLNYFNKDENFLTKMFTLEYSYWFDYLLPGLFKLSLPIPLGGTSNHFDVEKLKEIGAWDSFNTTEDADLGVRAFSKGYKVGVINSTTYEEANAHYRNWIKQRSRWIKGYMQTWLVHSRNLGKLYKAVGLKGFIGFNLLIGGTVFVFLVNPIMWFTFIVWLITQTQILQPIFPPVALYISLFNLLFGNFIGIYLNMIAVFRRRYYELLPYAFLNPVYWVMHSIASYKALYELFVKPFYWQKTQHGITKYKPPITSHAN